MDVWLHGGAHLLTIMILSLNWHAEFGHSNTTVVPVKTRGQPLASHASEIPHRCVKLHQQTIGVKFGPRVLAVTRIGDIVRRRVQNIPPTKEIQIRSHPFATRPLAAIVAADTAAGGVAVVCFMLTGSRRTDCFPRFLRVPVVRGCRKIVWCRN